MGCMDRKTAALKEFQVSTWPQNAPQPNLIVHTTRDLPEKLGSLPTTQDFHKSIVLFILYLGDVPGTVM